MNSGVYPVSPTVRDTERSRRRKPRRWCPFPTPEDPHPRTLGRTVPPRL